MGRRVRKRPTRVKGIAAWEGKRECWATGRSKPAQLDLSMPAYGPKPARKELAQPK